MCVLGAGGKVRRHLNLNVSNFVSGAYITESKISTISARDQSQRQQC